MGTKKPRTISEAYTKIYEISVEGESGDHKQLMMNLASEIAAVAFRIKKGEVRPDDGERLMDIAKNIETEYRD